MGIFAPIRYQRDREIAPRAESFCWRNFEEKEAMRLGQKMISISLYVPIEF